MENLHGSIAVPLEHILRSVFGFVDRPIGTTFDADAIESSTFYDSMCLVITKKNIEDGYKFIDKYVGLKDMSLHQIGSDTALKVFAEFKELIK